MTKPDGIIVRLQDDAEYYGQWVAIDIGGDRDRLILIDIVDGEGLDTPEVAKIVEAITKAFTP
jgi:hypothetical protein